MTSNHIHVVDNFISEQDASILRNFFDINFSWYSTYPWLPPLCQYSNGPVELEGEFAREIAIRKSNTNFLDRHELIDHYGNLMAKEASKFYGSTLIHFLEPYIKKFATGSDHQPHADSEQMSNGVVNFMPNYSPTDIAPPVLIEVACNLYLNDDFEGGELFFPNLDISIKPKSCQLIIFPGGHEYVHGVKQVTSGFRYVLFSPLTSPQRLLLHMGAFNLKKELEKNNGF